MGLLVQRKVDPAVRVRVLAAPSADSRVVASGRDVSTFSQWGCCHSGIGGFDVDAFDHVTTRATVDDRRLRPTDRTLAGKPEDADDGNRCTRSGAWRSGCSNSAPVRGASRSRSSVDARPWSSQESFSFHYNNCQSFQRYCAAMGVSPAAVTTSDDIRGDSVWTRIWEH
jgi:hypothetical protein